MGIAFWVWQRQSEQEPSKASDDRSPDRSRGDLLQAIASLDDEFDAGKLDPSAYEERRSALKSQIMERLPKDD